VNVCTSYNATLNILLVLVLVSYPSFSKTTFQSVYGISVKCKDFALVSKLSKIKKVWVEVPHAWCEHAPSAGCSSVFHLFTCSPTYAWTRPFYCTRVLLLFGLSRLSKGRMQCEILVLSSYRIIV
jgi:hypothetical protein